MSQDTSSEHRHEGATPTSAASVVARQAAPDLSAREMPCPQCGHPMPDLKGGKASICPVCGFKDSCCY